MSEHFVHRADGSVEQVTEDEFQKAIDLELAQHNNGVIPVTDEERRIIIERIQRGT